MHLNLSCCDVRPTYLAQSEAKQHARAPLQLSEANLDRRQPVPGRSLQASVAHSSPRGSLPGVGYGYGCQIPGLRIAECAWLHRRPQQAWTNHGVMLCSNQSPFKSNIKNRPRPPPLPLAACARSAPPGEPAAKLGEGTLRFASLAVILTSHAFPLTAAGRGSTFACWGSACSGS